MNDDDDRPYYVDEFGNARVPVEYRRIRNRDDRIAALVRHAFDRAKHRGGGR